MWKRTSLERIPRSFPLGYLRRNSPACHKVIDDGKGKTDGFSTADAMTVHTAFANKNDDELRDSGTQALKGKRTGFGMRVDITLCSSPHTDI